MRKQSRWVDVVLILLLALLPWLFFWRLVTPNPADRMHIAAGDFTEQYFPLRAFAAQEWVRGRVPLWNPYINGGQPALADIQSGALYPPHVLEALLLGWGGPLLGRETGFPLWALEWQVIGHFSLAAVGAFLFARHLYRQSGRSHRQSSFGAVIASVVFTYSGYLTGFPVQQLTILEASAWLPWVLWGLSAALSRYLQPGPGEQPGLGKSLRPAVGGAAALGLAILAGHPQTALYIVYLSLAYTALYVYRAWSMSLARRAAGLAGLWVLVVILGAGLASAQVLPALEFIGYSLRADMSYPAVAAGLPLPELMSLLYPGFFGGSPVYVGIASLVLIGLALALGRPRFQIYFWAALGLASLLLAFGGSTFLYPSFYLLAPGFETVRQQERVLLLYSFSAGLLAGYGATVLAGALSKAERQTWARFERSLRLVAGVALALTVFLIYGSTAATARGDEVNLFFGVLWHHLFGLLILGGMLLLLAGRSRRWLRRPWGMGLAAAWLVFNLFTVNWRFNLEQPASNGPFTPDEITRFLQANLPDLNAAGLSAPPGRIASAGLLPGGHSAAAVYNLEDLTGNTPLQIARMARFAGQMPAWRYWQLMNVRYVVDTRDIAGEGLRPVLAAGERQVYAVGDPFPRAWPVSQVEEIGPDEAAARRLAADDFELGRTAVVPGPLREAVSPGVAAAVVDVLAVGPDYLQVAVEASGAHLLVLSQVYYPGWLAKIDGQPAEVLRVNVTQQGVLVPAGAHRVELIFRPASFRSGVILTAVAMTISLALLFRPRFRQADR